MLLPAYAEPAGESEVRDLMESVSQKIYPQTDGSYERTMWGIVYCPEGYCAEFYFKENYRQSYILTPSNGSDFPVRNNEEM